MGIPRLANPSLQPWRKLGYEIHDTLPRLLRVSVFYLEAIAPRCTEYRLRLLFEGTRQVSVEVLQAPKGRKRLWRPIPSLTDLEIWQRTPAAWFERTVESQLRKETESD